MVGDSHSRTTPNAIPSMGLEGDVEKTTTQAGLKIRTLENVFLGGTRIRAKVEEVFEEAGMRRNTQESFAKMHEDGNQEN